MLRETFTITYGDVAENHKGMQKIGLETNRGLKKQDLLLMKRWFELNGAKCSMINLQGFLPIQTTDLDAYILVVRDGIDTMFSKGYADKFLTELQDLEWDSKAFMYGRVVNKKSTT